MGLLQGAQELSSEHQGTGALSTLEADLRSVVGPAVPLDSSADLFERYVQNPSVIPLELVGAALTRLLDSDINKIEGDLRKIIKAMGSDTSVQKYLLQIFVSTWAEENGFRMVSDSNISPHIREAREILKNQEKDGKLKRMISVLLGKDKVTYTELITMAEQLAADNVGLEEKKAQLQLENMGLMKERSTIVGDAQVKAEQILRDARSEASKLRAEGEKFHEEAKKQGEEIIRSAQNESESIIAELEGARLEQEREIARLTAVKNTLLAGTPGLERLLYRDVDFAEDKLDTVVKSAQNHSQQLLGAIYTRNPELFVEYFFDLMRAASSWEAKSKEQKDGFLDMVHYLVQKGCFINVFRTPRYSSKSDISITNIEIPTTFNHNYSNFDIESDLYGFSHSIHHLKKTSLRESLIQTAQSKIKEILDSVKSGTTPKFELSKHLLEFLK